MMLCACSGDEKHSDKSVFKFNLAEGITSLDPAFARSQTNIWACNQLFNGLVQLDQNLNVKPCIAKNWSVDNEGTKYTFQLRNDVFFHDHDLHLKLLAYAIATCKNAETMVI